MDGAIVYLFIAVLATFTLSFLMVFHLPAGPWIEGVGLAFGGLGCIGLFYLFVLINEGPRYIDKAPHVRTQISWAADAPAPAALAVRVVQ